MPHLATKFVVFVFECVNFTSVKRAEKGRFCHQNRWFAYAFEACERSILHKSVPFPSFGIAETKGLLTTYLIVFLLFR